MMRTTEQINKTGASSLRFLYNTAVGRVLLRPLICPFVSRVAGWFLDRRMSKCFVKRFIKSNGIDMTDYEKCEFNSFNDFFTRKVLPDARPVDSTKDGFASPCDARLTAFTITEDSEFSVKGSSYKVADLLCDKELADTFLGGCCLIFRLAVDNYHRYGYAADGVTRDTVHIKGKYHTVQPIAMRRFPIFKENVREYTVIDTTRFGVVVQMEVGALMVGRIKNNFVTSETVTKGQEKGMFEFGGSTIVVLTQKDKVCFDKEFFENTENGLETNVKYGEKIGICNGTAK